MNSDFSYLASKCFNLTSKNLSKSCTCPSVSLDSFWTFFCIFFVSFQNAHTKKINTCKIILTFTTKEPKIYHALATTSAFNLKLCPIELASTNRFSCPSPLLPQYHLIYKTLSWDKTNIKVWKQYRIF